MNSVDWMMVADRVMMFVAGCIVGYIFSSIRDSMHECARQRVRSHRNEKGTFSMPRFRGINIALFLVVCATIYAAVASQISINKTSDLYTVQINASQCTSDTLLAINKAVDERTDRSEDQSAANADLQRAQAEFLSTIVVPPEQVNPMQVRQQLSEYYTALTEYLDAYKSYNEVAIKNPYPKPNAFVKCLDEAGVDIKQEDR